MMAAVEEADGVATRLFTRSLRYMMMFAALGAALGALLMFWLGASKLLHAVRSGAVADPLATTTMVTSVMGGTDAFLFGVVLITLLGRALSMLPKQEAETMAEEVGLEYGRLMARSMGDIGETQKSFRTALHAVADALTAHGFAAHAERSHNSLRIVSEHCPFGGAAIEHPVICAVDRGMVRGMLGALYGQDLMTETALSLPTGGERCVTSVQGS